MYDGYRGTQKEQVVNSNACERRKGATKIDVKTAVRCRWSEAMGA